jgi:hypothetical protein
MSTPINEAFEREARDTWKRTQSDLRLAAVNGKATGSVWPSPDMSVCERSQIRPPVLPTSGFGPLRDWLDSAAEAAAAPVDYVALSLLTAASGMIGGRRKASPWAGWVEPCIIWGAIVGDPSVNKTPATDPVRAAVVVAEDDKARNYQEAEAKYETDLAASRAVKKIWERAVEKALKAGDEPPAMPRGAIEPKRPVRPRCWVSNVTTDKLARILSEDPGGVVAWNNELASLIGSFDRYGGSGADKGFWLGCYDGRPERLDRVKDGTIEVPAAAAAVLGTIQPDRLNTLILTGDNDGFASRFLYAWPAARERKRPRVAPNQDILHGAFKRLASLTAEERILPLEDSAVEAFQVWWEEGHSRDIKAASGMLAEAYSKLSGGALRIALDLEYIWWSASPGAPEPKYVSYNAVAHALVLVDDWAKPMARRVLAEASVPRSQLQAASLARWIRTTRRTTFNARTALRQHRSSLPGIRDTKDMDEACAALVEAGWIRAAGTREGDTKGRRSKDFEVNPAVLGNEIYGPVTKGTLGPIEWLQT